MIKLTSNIDLRMKDVFFYFEIRSGMQCDVVVVLIESLLLLCRSVPGQLRVNAR